MTVHIAYLAEEQTGLAAGTRVVEPPARSHQAQRGGFFAVVELRGTAPGGPQLAERLLSTLQRSYYNAKGTQSQVLTEAMRQANHLLQVENQRVTPTWSVGIICVGLLIDRVAMAGMGDAVAFITTDGGSVNVYPPDRLEPTVAGQDTGRRLWPIHRQKLDSSGVIVAGSGSWLERVSARTLAGAAAYVTADNIQAAAEGLREQAGRSDLPGLLIVVDKHPPTPPPPPPDGGVAPRPGGPLPTAVDASPPVTSAPPVEVSEQAAAQEAADPADVAPEDHEGESSEEPPSPPPPPVEGVPVENREEGAESDRSADSAVAKGLALASTVAAGAKVGIRRARELAKNMLPDRNSAEYAEYDGGAHSMAVLETALPAVALQPGIDLAPAEVDASVVPPFVPPQQATGGRARIFLALAILLLILVPALVAAVFLQQGVDTQQQATELLNLADARLRSAMDALDQDDKETARSMLTDARAYVRQAEELVGSTERSLDLLGKIDDEYKAVVQAIILYGLTQPLTVFLPEAEPQRVLAVGQDLYVMDSGQGQVLRFRLDTTGESLVDGTGQVVLSEGDVVEGVVVGSLVDIAWQNPIPGYEDKSNLLMLDDRNHVFRFDEQVDGATLSDFGTDNGWQRASQIEVYLDRLYVLDEGANQIYRYAPGDYAGPPLNWFPETTSVNLRGVRSMRIDGDIWLLYDDGKVVRYHSGEQVPYGLDDSVDAASQAVDLYVATETDSAIYLADAVGEVVQVFDKESGDYRGQMQAAEGRPLRGLRGIFVDETRESLFFLTDEALYTQSLPN